MNSVINNCFHRCKTSIISGTYDLVSNKKSLSNKKYQRGLVQALF